MFIKVIPVDLFRMGTKNNSQLHKLRTMPPRVIEQSFDIEIYPKDGIDFVAKDSGGISTFDRENPGLAGFWWKIPKGTKIPFGLRISRDFNPRPANQPTH
jgi:hypothetical protein